MIWIQDHEVVGAKDKEEGDQATCTELSKVAARSRFERSFGHTWTTPGGHAPHYT